MEKLASNTPLGKDQCQNIAMFTFATALAAPVVGLGREQVKLAADAYKRGLQKATDRHEKLVDMLTQHVKAPASA